MFTILDVHMSSMLQRPCVLWSPMCGWERPELLMGALIKIGGMLVVGGNI